LQADLRFTANKCDESATNGGRRIVGDRLKHFVTNLKSSGYAVQLFLERKRRRIRIGGGSMTKCIYPLIGMALALAGTVGAALAQPPTLGYRDPSDSLQPVPPTTYRPVTSGLQSFRPTDPLPWGSQNDKVAPKPKAGGEGQTSGQ
jgi:hypothetical protein